MSELHLIPASSNPAAENWNLPFAITQFPCAVGRSLSCEMRLDDPMISRRHCLFCLREGQVWFEDLGSRNGSRINGEPVDEPRPIADGDTLELAGLTFRVCLPAPTSRVPFSRDTVSPI